MCKNIDEIAASALLYNIVMSNEQTTRPPAKLGRALKNGFVGIYDHLAYVVLATIAWFMISSTIYAAMAYLARLPKGVPSIMRFVILTPAVLVAYVCAVGVFYYAYKAASHDHPVVADTLVGIKKLFVPAVKLFVIDGAITCLLVLDCAFFVSMISKGGVYLVMAVVSAYMLLLWGVLSLYHLPLLVAQVGLESGPKPGVIFKKSFLLALDNPSFTLGLFAVIIAVTVLCVVPKLVGVAVVYLGVVSFILVHALRELFAKYGIVEIESEPAEDDHWTLPEP